MKWHCPFASYLAYSRLLQGYALKPKAIYKLHSWSNTQPPAQGDFIQIFSILEKKQNKTKHTTLRSGGGSLCAFG